MMMVSGDSGDGFSSEDVRLLFYLLLSFEVVVCENHQLHERESNFVGLSCSTKHVQNKLNEERKNLVIDHSTLLTTRSFHVANYKRFDGIFICSCSKFLPILY